MPDWLRMRMRAGARSPFRRDEAFRVGKSARLEGEEDGKSGRNIRLARIIVCAKPLLSRLMIHVETVDKASSRFSIRKRNKRGASWAKGLGSLASASSENFLCKSSALVSRNG
jgi:hypothetical protein